MALSPLSGRMRTARSTAGTALAAALVVAWLAAPDTALAQALAIASAPAPPPDALAAPVRAALLPSAVTIKNGDTTLEVWLASGVAVSAEGPGWDAVESGTLVGALRVTGAFKEIRGKVVKPGVYTLRFGLQPQNGDHLGISANRQFLLVSPAAVDTDPKGLGYDGAVALAKQTTGTSHPSSLSLDPPDDAGTPLAAVTNDLGHQGVAMEVKQSLNGTPVGTIRFGLIVVGLIVH